jgi:bifunctional NMN adenylyltransferase/nudix hydrolase
MEHKQNARLPASLKDVAVYIGRFNPFHLGHAYVLEAALKTSKLVIVLVGSAGQARSLKNPFTFAEREQMISSWFVTGNNDQHGDLIILPLQDHPYNDTKWIESVQDKVRGAMTKYCISRDIILTDVTLTGSNRDESTWYLSSFPQWKSELQPEYSRADIATKVSATSVREIMYGSSSAAPDLLPFAKAIVGTSMKAIADNAPLKDVRAAIDGAVAELLDELRRVKAVPPLSAAEALKVLRLKVPTSTAQFIERFMTTDECALLRREWDFVRAYKAAWSVAPYAPIFVTTDAVLVQSGHVLVIVRGAFPGEGLWALPGGFLDPNERLVTCAVREVMEETGIKLAEGKRADEITKAMLLGSIKDEKNFDKPDRSSRGRTVTTAFLMQLDDTKPLAKVKGMNAPLHETGGEVVVETRKAFWLPISEALRRTDMWFEDHHAILETMVARLPQVR